MSPEWPFGTTLNSNPPWHPQQPYNSLPPLPPAAELETRVVLKQCITARAALAELKQAAELIPNQTMLINTLPLLEAKDSSEIENIVTTTDSALARDNGHTPPGPYRAPGTATPELAARRRALRVAMEQALQPANPPEPACAAPATGPEENDRPQIEALLWAEAGSMAESALPPGRRALESLVNRL